MYAISLFCDTVYCTFIPYTVLYCILMEKYTNLYYKGYSYYRMYCIIHIFNTLHIALKQVFS